MVVFRIEVDAECVDIGDSHCDFAGQDPTIECFDGGLNGGACEYLCFNYVKKIEED